MHAPAGTPGCRSLSKSVLLHELAAIVFGAPPHHSHGTELLFWAPGQFWASTAGQDFSKLRRPKFMVTNLSSILCLVCVGLRHKTTCHSLSQPCSCNAALREPNRDISYRSEVSPDAVILRLATMITNTLLGSTEAMSGNVAS